MTDHWHIGRTPFPLLEDDNDYSGKDFDSVYLENSKALSHAFLNGTSFKNSAFVDAALDQCEFGEATFEDTHFVNAYLDGADFVRATFVGGRFENCDLTDGEWRENVFKGVVFDRCKFSHTTVNLCTFLECTFLNGSTAGLDYKAVNYNVFSRCSFDEGIASEIVLSRNFGLKPAKPSSSLVPADQGVTLEQICRVSGLGLVKAFDFVRAVENECTNFHGRMKKLRFEFISNIVGSMAWERRIAPATLLYIEGLFASLAGTIGDEGDLRAVMSALITVRNSLLDRLNDILLLDTPNLDTICTQAVIEYTSAFSEDDAVALVQSLDEILAAGRGTISLASYKLGSTFINIDLTTTVCTAASVLMAVNFILSQAKVTISRFRALKQEFIRPPRRASRKRRHKLQNKVPTLLFKERSIPELTQLRKVVQKRGRTLARMDEPADVTLMTPQGDEMKETKD